MVKIKTVILSIFLLLLIVLKLNLVTEFFQDDDNYPNIYYINLKHRIDRKKHFLKQFNKINYPSNKIIIFRKETLLLNLRKITAIYTINLI